MKPEILLRDTFEAHEHLAPDAESVLDEVHRRVRGPRHRTSLAVAASVALVAGASGVAVLAARHEPTRTQAQPAAASPLPTHHAPPKAPEIAPLTMAFDLGWLPDGDVHYLARRINIGAVDDNSPPVFDGEYLMTVTAGGHTIDLDVQQMPGGLDGVMFKSGPGESTTIAGRPGVQSSNSSGPGGYEVYFRNSDGGTMYVNAGPSAGDGLPAADLVDLGRHVAEQIRFPGTTQVQPSFGVGFVPAGTAVQSFDVGGSGAPLAGGGTRGSGGPTTTYTIGTADDPMQVNVVQGGLSNEPGAHPGRDVQGHPTELAGGDGWRTLTVQGAVDGDAVTLSGDVSSDELYAVADGLVLP